ncbi:hypothetical protein FisN_4Lh171 [Fistulifera solaris]|uniref:Uncharacterized protein n=1 Tax=Fistulifera solaris TaxID=1519565 RepID=A0A1Z5JYZ5_FISSO|nr:hypothetical protein FisN_4Lh171 [Fistulifera solaris]|eukprot:GAX19245.1 hypothetical protein FisN_4Lh171 [Fistulifera solaris]
MTEEDTRKKEIIQFAAMAVGVKDESPATAGAITGNNTPTNNMTSADNAFLDSIVDNTTTVGSGSLRFPAPGANAKHRLEAEQSNLNAAIALLSEPVVEQTSSKAKIPADGKGLVNSTERNPQRIKPENDIPMFCEKVEMHRPLFFGPIVPPRVIKEARYMLREAIDEFQKGNPGIKPRLNQLPPAVRNVVGALRVFGFGLDIMKETANDTEPEFVGSDLVSTYQPVWGHDERAKRVKSYMKDRPEPVRKPSIVSRSFTAPATMSKKDLRRPRVGESQVIGEEEDNIPDKIVSENQLFSMWLRQDDESTNRSGEHSRSESQSSIHIVEDADQPQSEEEVNVTEDEPGSDPAAKDEMELFSLWATQSEGGTFVSSKSGSFRPSQSLTRRVVDSDDESLHEDEMKKQVGISDHLSKAIALLTGDMDEGGTADIPIEASRLLSQQVPEDGSRLRPLSNYELTNGCVPLFAADDKALPDSADLGIHETREEQVRSNELKRSQETIERFVIPDLFGTVACPNPALRSDDNHSWNSRTAMLRQTCNITRKETSVSDSASVQTKRTIGSIDSSDLGRARASPVHVRRKEPKMKRRQSRLRCGWFNQSKNAIRRDKKVAGRQLHVPPASLVEKGNTALLTGLEPNPDVLRENNLPLSHLHAATPVEQSLPYLSDRPHGYRYLQIDTQAVGFPSLNGEIEPLFCSLAIYHVETISDVPGNDPTPAPIPDLQRCAKVTEALYFDVVGDGNVATRCSGALWPYSVSDASDDRLTGTRCGIFPLPSNLNVSNLYAVLMVRKVLADVLDLEPYLVPNSDAVDLEHLRSNAERASYSHGHLLVPLAFGVAPLLQVFGAENPAVVVSRAVQIPLFQFNGEEKQIIEHIMVMLFPRANPSIVQVGGPALMTNGGSAMLVMRNFGYLGIHNAVDNKSSLARDRLVDFTGELQVKREGDDVDENPMILSSDFTVRTAKVLPGLTTEATVDGGRDSVESYGSFVSKPNSYAQELAPIPLSLIPTTGESSTTRKGRLSGQDIEPFFHTVFYNELIFQPRILHNCDRDMIVLGVEVRELEWMDGFGYLAHLPERGSSIHNHRRGPFLISESFTTCATRKGTTEHHYFIDEFKTKLPLDLAQKRKDGCTRSLTLFFTVYHVKWDASVLMPTKEAVASLSRVKENKEAKIHSCLEQMICGFLPLSEKSRLVSNGIHDVQLSYEAQAVPKTFCEKWDCSTTTLLLAKQHSGSESLQAGQSYIEPIALVNKERVTDPADSTIAVANVTKDEPMSLSVRIVALTSLHSQDEALSDLLNEESDYPNNVMHRLETKFLSDIKINRQSLLRKALEAVPKKDDTIETHLVNSTLTTSSKMNRSLPTFSPFILRMLPTLWRQFALGHGEASLVWSNPASLIPLRLHSFAAILHLLEGTCVFFSKNGVTEADGMRKWNRANLGRVISLLFDEENLFGDQSKEAIDRDNWSLILDSRDHQFGFLARAKPHGGRHVRSRLELSDRTKQGNTTSEFRDNDFLSTVAGALAGPVRGLNERDTPFDGTSNEPFAYGANVRIDSKVDFQNALRASLAENSEEDVDRLQSTKTSGTSMTMMQALSSLSDTGSRRYMTLPAPRTLMTISEADDGEDDNPEFEEEAQDNKIADLDAGTRNSLANNPTNQKHAHGVRQMRIPARRNSKHVTRTDSLVEGMDPNVTPSSSLNEKEAGLMPLPPSDDDFEKLNIGFLDTFGENIKASSHNTNSEEVSRNASRNHRRIRSRSSIDWTLNGVDALKSSSNGDSLRVQRGDSREVADTMTMLCKEELSSIPVPNFIDRLVAMGKNPNKPARWFPYVYEILICQWSYLLVKQKHSGAAVGGLSQENGNSLLSILHAEESLPRPLSGSSSILVAGAPVLLEVIKQSLGFRIHSVFREILSKQDDWTTPPLIILDETLMASLEQIIGLLTDACLDQRNFDEWDLRQTSVDVNESIILFVRDMFSYLAPSCVQRLILTYFSRFLDKENIQDRDSKVGLRCSWETTKLRLDATTALIRFVDLIKINSPYMLNWRAWWEIPSMSMDEKFFNSSLVTQFKTLGVITCTDGAFPSMRPHWLVELLVDVCLKGTEHVETHIQQRAASLLYELIWGCSQESISNGIRTPVATMFFTLLEKLLMQGSYLSNFSPKNSLRKHLLPCFVYVLQWATPGLLRTYYRDLCNKLQGRGQSSKYEIVAKISDGFEKDSPELSHEGGEDQVVNEGEHSIVDMFTMLNLALKTLEYEGEEYAEPEETSQGQENVEIWRREYLLSPMNRTSNANSDSWGNHVQGDEPPGPVFTSSVARRWQGHDAAMVIVNSVHHIILEMYGMMRKSPKGSTFLNPAVHRSRSGQAKAGADSGENSTQNDTFKLTSDDVLLFVRSSTSVYLHALSLEESDLVTIRTLSLLAEVIKIFGIGNFLEAIGETLQHWMRVILLHCGARRASVRIESTDLLELILRTTWECFGSFFRIRVPLLAVQTEVMERIFATAASRYYHEQRLTINKSPIEPFPSVSAEASLAPFWRTLDRMETQPASQNVAFREALIRMAGKLKILYRAYIATRVLSLLRIDIDRAGTEELDFETESKLRAARISIMRVVNASSGHSKQFLGFQGTRQDNSDVAHYEAVEDALLDAADVFSSTELPEHRCAWLRVLAELHANRKKFAEEATCHFQIYITLSQAALLHGSLWTNTPFLPWTENLLDPGYANGGSENYQSDLDLDDGESLLGRPTMGNVSSRRMFYRVANSVGEGANNSFWDIASTKTLFCGVALPSEYHSVKSWLSLKQMEENMVEEAEAAGELFLKAGIIDNSRFAWNLAAQYFAERFNYNKLQSIYGNLSRAVVTQVPTIDPDVPQEVTSTLGRFYRVWFHGGAPDELTGMEFVYRAESSLCLAKFGAELKQTVKSIIQENTPIHLVLDGRVEERLEEGIFNVGNYGRIGPAPLAPVKVKVTPLRPLFSMRRLARGLPEWFYHYVEDASANPTHLLRGEVNFRRCGTQHSGNKDKHDPHHREHSRSFTVNVFSSFDPATGIRVGGQAHNHNTVVTRSREGNSTGVDRFCFLQPRDRHKGSKDWWKTATTAGIVEKSVKVTQLQVSQPFPTCVARQPVVHRLVYSISPLEAGVDAVSQWCSLLFSTAAATVGTAVLGTNADPGIGTEAAKVVVDSIHSSHIKEMGLSLLRNTSEPQQENDDAIFLTSFDRHTEDEIHKLQIKFAKLIVVFLELLHVLIARNRSALLEIIQERKPRDSDKKVPATASISKANNKSSAEHMRTGSTSSGGFGITTPGSLTGQDPHFRQPSGSSSTGQRRHTAKSSEDSNSKQNPQSHHKKVLSEDLNSVHSNLSSPAGVRADSAIAVQSELQRSFTNLVKALQPNLQVILQNGFPRWLKQCTQENYFSSGGYRSMVVSIEKELCLASDASAIQGLRSSGDANSQNQFDPNLDSEVIADSIIGGSSQSIMSKGSDRYGFVSF